MPADGYQLRCLCDTASQLLVGSGFVGRLVAPFGRPESIVVLNVAPDSVKWPGKGSGDFLAGRGSPIDETLTGWQREHQELTQVFGKHEAKPFLDTRSEERRVEKESRF